MADDSLKNWERKTLKELLFAHVNEKKRARRWGIFFKLILVTLIGIYVYYNWFDKGALKGKISMAKHIALVNVEGFIGPGSENTAENIIESLQNAFQNKDAVAVILQVNSTGGTPVHSRQVYREIKRLKLSYPEKPIYGLAVDIAASGGYLILSAADQIYADETSIVGSIGAIMRGFGFVESMQKLGIERRVYASGNNKSMLDPFLPRNAEDEAFITQQIQSVHQSFVDDVVAGRGERLSADPELFTGKFWVGKRALELGLIDSFGDLQGLKNNVIKNDRVIDYTVGNGLLSKIPHKLSALANLPVQNHLAANWSGVAIGE